MLSYYRIKITYDGTDFYGWQIQPQHSSICQILQDTFFRIFNHKVIIIGASRTDAGVHALGQIALMKTSLKISSERMKSAWNKALPSTIQIRTITETDNTFHPHHNVQYKTYYYHFFLVKPLPFLQRYGWYYYHPCNLTLLQNTLNAFIGTHNFRAFSTGEPLNENPICSIYQAKIVYLRRYNAYRIIIQGDRFLRHMVRRLVGAALEVANSNNNNATLEMIQVLLTSQNPANTLFNAPPHGLILYSIVYK